jgi:hypothetical protein
MMFKLEYYGQVSEDGLLKITNRKQFDIDLKRYAGKDVEIVISKKKSKRSNQQNRYYWGVVVGMIQQGLKDIGYDFDKQKTHDFIKGNFCYKDSVDEQTGEIRFREPISTTEMSKIEFEEMLSRLKIFAAEYLNTVIPDPNEDLTLQI